MTVHIMPRKKRRGYSTTFDVCCVGFDYVLNFPDYTAAKKFCDDNGFDVYQCKAKKVEQSRCRIYLANGRKVFDSNDRLW